MDVKYQISDESLLPYYKNLNDAGMDIRSSEEIVLKRGETKIIKTGLKLEIPPGFLIFVAPRSGISANTPLRIANSPGTIDSGYRGEIGIIVSNTSTHGMKQYLISEKNNKNGSYVIKAGDRLAQIILLKIYPINFIKGELDMTNDRDGGFGSTGYV